MTNEYRRVATSGGELAYLDIGEGPTVLLLHGFPFSSSQWRHLMPLLAARFRVIAPDLPAAGISVALPGVRLDLSAQAGYVRELLLAAGVERFAVVGHGTGAGIAQLLALDGNDVDAMVLLDALGGWPAGAEVPDDAEVGDRQAPDRLLEALAGDALADRRTELGGLGFPVLLLWGEDDPLAPVIEAEALNEAIPSSTLGVLPGCAHVLTREAPATIDPMIMEYLRAMYLHESHGHDASKDGVVMLQLERRPPWLDLEDDERDDWFDVDDTPAGDGHA